MLSHSRLAAAAFLNVQSRHSFVIMRQVCTVSQFVHPMNWNAKSSGKHHGKKKGNILKMGLNLI